MKFMRVHSALTGRICSNKRSEKPRPGKFHSENRRVPRPRNTAYSHFFIRDKGGRLCRCRFFSSAKIDSRAARTKSHASGRMGQRDILRLRVTLLGRHDLFYGVVLTSDLWKVLLGTGNFGCRVSRGSIRSGAIWALRSQTWKFLFNQNIWFAEFILGIVEW